MGVDITGPGTAYLDIIEGVKWQEEHGVVTSVQRMFIVTGLPTPITSADGTTSGSLDSNMKLALAHSDIPRAGDAHPMEPAVFVKARSARAISPTQVNILVSYARPGGGTFPPGTSTFVVSGGSSIEQYETSKYPIDQPTGNHGLPYVYANRGGLPNGTFDPELGAKRNQNILVKKPPGPAWADEKFKNVVTPISAFEARPVIHLQDTFPAQSPWLRAQFLVNTVNAPGPPGNPGWFYSPGAAARTWLVTDYQFELLDPKTSPPTYRHSITLAGKASGWDPQVIWTDPETGLGSAEQPEGDTVFRVAFHDMIDFDNEIL